MLQDVGHHDRVECGLCLEVVSPIRVVEVGLNDARAKGLQVVGRHWVNLERRHLGVHHFGQGSGNGAGPRPDLQHTRTAIHELDYKSGRGLALGVEVVGIFQLLAMGMGEVQHGAIS